MLLLVCDFSIVIMRCRYWALIVWFVFDSTTKFIVLSNTAVHRLTGVNSGCTLCDLLCFAIVACQIVWYHLSVILVKSKDRKCDSLCVSDFTIYSWNSTTQSQLSLCTYASNFMIEIPSCNLHSIHFAFKIWDTGQWDGKYMIRLRFREMVLNKV